MNKKTLKLPTLATFKKLSFKAKAIIFRDWAATQSGSYNAMDTNSCALSQFSKAMGGMRDIYGSSYSIYTKLRTEVPVLDEALFFGNSVIFNNKPSNNDISTFSNLVKRLNSHIKQHYAN